MGTIQTGLGAILRMEQEVTVGGLPTEAVWCANINRSSGFGGTTASFRMPVALFDTARAWLRDALVVVRVSDGVLGFGPVDFAGFLDVDNATLSDSDDSMELTASTVTGYLHRVYVGQDDGRSVVRHHLTDPVTGFRTTPARILNAILRDMPAGWRAYVGLGDAKVLNTTEQNAAVPELVFRGATVQAAIEQVMAIFGDVAFLERFTGSGKCLLDFYRIQAPELPRVSVTVGQWNDIVESGANVASLSHNQTSGDAITRVIVNCAPRRFIVSTHTGMDPPMGLRKAWDPELEAAVLADPRRATPNQQGYEEGMEHVFRRFALPAALDGVTTCKDFAVNDTRGQVLQSHAWKIRTILVFDEEAGKLVGEEAPDPEVIKSVSWDMDKGFLTLGQTTAGLNKVAVEMATVGEKEVQKTTWAPALVGVTIAIESDAHVLTGDTGVAQGSGVRLPFASADGLTEMILRDDLLFVQATNAGWPVGEAEFPAYIWDPVAEEWMLFTSAVVFKDDGDTARTLARDTLRARMQRHSSVSADVVGVARAYQPGRLLSVRGVELNTSGTLMITGVTFDMDGIGTSITADNVKPPLRRRMTRGDARKLYKLDDGGGG